MAYIDPCSATNDVDMREFMFTLVLFLVGADDNYCGEMAWGLFSLASGGARGLAREPHSGVYPCWSHHDGMKCLMA